MGVFSSAWKSIKNAGKKVAKVAFKPIKALVVDPLKKIWENKYGRMLMIGGAVIGGGIALSGLMAGAATGGAAAGATGGAAAGATGGASAAGSASALGSTYSAGLGTAAGSSGAAAGSAGLGATYSAGLGTAAGAGGTGGALAAGGANLATLTGAGATAGSGGLLSAAGGWAASNPLLASTALNTGGQMIAGYAQGRAAEEQAEELRRQELEDRNRRSAWGVTYDGKTDAGIDTGGLMAEATRNYQSAPPPTPTMPQNEPQPAYNSNDWWNRKQERTA